MGRERESGEHFQGLTLSRVKETLSVQGVVLNLKEVQVDELKTDPKGSLTLFLSP